MGVSKQYTKKLKKEFDYSATWLPTTIVKPGDVGKLANYMFTHVANLNDFGIKYGTIGESSNLEFEYCSSDSVSINAKVSGQAPVAGSNLSVADAGVNIKFSKGKGIVFRLSKCTSARIADMNAVGSQIASIYDKKWKKDLVVVYEAVKANSATIIISNSSDAQIDLRAKGQASAGAIDLADVNAEFQIAKKSKIATNIIASEGLTPLFKASGFKKRFFGGGLYWDLGEELNKKDNVKFGRVDYADFEK